MWKWTGSSRSAQTSQRGSQALLARSGAPRSWGSEVMLIPRSPRLSDPLGLADAVIDVPSRQDGHGQQAVVRALLDLCSRVVEDLYTESTQREVLHLAQGLAPQTERVRIQDLVLDAHVVEYLEAGVDIPRGNMGTFEIPLDHRFQEGVLHSVSVDGASAAGLPDRRPLDDPLALSVDVLDVQDLILVGRWGSLRPKVLDVGEMRIGVQNSQSLRHLGGESHLVGSSRFRDHSARTLRLAGYSSALTPARCDTGS